MRVLIIEDEPKVAAFIKKGLEMKNFETEVALDGERGLSLALSRTFDVIVLDLNLPVLNGFEVCRLIRARGCKTPILMLTALSTTRDKVQGFETGADDYLVKPFDFEELVARLKALVKRSNYANSQEPVLRVADLELNSESKTVSRNGTPIELTAKEFALLEYLMRNKGRVLSRADIAEKVWDLTFDTGTNIIDLYIYYLRRKIDKNFNQKLIHTQVGMGYVLKEKP